MNALSPKDFETLFREHYDGYFHYWDDEGVDELHNIRIDGDLNAVTLTNHINELLFRAIHGISHEEFQSTDWQPLFKVWVAGR